MHFFMKNAACSRHPLYIAGADFTGISGIIFMLWQNL
jgi:hypothetical protein